MSNTKQDYTKFVIGGTVRVWQTKGVKDLGKGPSSSERSNAKGATNPYADIEPSEDLLVKTRLNNQEFICEREDGSMVKIHQNHINEKAKYNTKVSATQTPAQKVEALKASLEKAQAELEAAQLAEMEKAELQAANG